MTITNPFAILGGIVGSLAAAYVLYVSRSDQKEPFDWQKFAIEAIPSLITGIGVAVATGDFVSGLLAGWGVKMGQKPLTQAASNLTG